MITTGNRLPLRRTLLALLLALSGCGQTPTAEIRALAESSDTFQAALTRNLSRDDSALIAKWREIDGCGLIFASDLRPHFSENDEFRSWLLATGFAEEISAVWRYRNFGGAQKDERTYLIYKPALQEHVEDGTLVIGRREFGEVTYTNSYEAIGPQGPNTPLHAIVFNYRIAATLPGWTSPLDVKEGKAIAYKDPTDGKLKLLRININDGQLPTIAPAAEDDQPPAAVTRLEGRSLPPPVMGEPFRGC